MTCHNASPWLKTNELGPWVHGNDGAPKHGARFSQRGKPRFVVHYWWWFVVVQWEKILKQLGFDSSTWRFWSAGLVANVKVVHPSHQNASLSLPTPWNWALWHINWCCWLLHSALVANAPVSLAGFSPCSRQMEHLSWNLLSWRSSLSHVRSCGADGLRG